MRLYAGFMLELVKLSSAKVKCPKCGHMNHASAEKCSNCGYHLGGSKEAAACPLATQDLKVNTKNRNKSIQAEHIQYGPLNLSDEGYWERLAKHWKTTPAVAKKSKCSNCVAFDISPRMQECMPGMVQEDGYLGYCHMHHFKCHSARTCYTWASGGPITKDEVSLDWSQGEKKAALSEDQKEVAISAAPAAVGIGTAGALMSKAPQDMIGRTGAKVVKSYGPALSDAEMKELGKKHNVNVVRGSKSSASGSGRTIQLGGGTGNRATFYHELGHLDDAGRIDRSKLQKGSVKHTLATLRNEAVANVRGVQKGGLQQLPHALGAQATYLASAAKRHRKGLSGIAAGTGALGTGALLLKRKITGDKNE